MGYNCLPRQHPGWQQWTKLAPLQRGSTSAWTSTSTQSEDKDWLLSSLHICPFQVHCWEGHVGDICGPTELR